jgi:SAM-dependent methyltransferase
MKKKQEPFDKYWYYSASVQSPIDDVRFYDRVYHDARGKSPRVLREDFCGTFINCCEWVKLGPERRAIGVDLDPEPIGYGREHYLPKLDAGQQSRVTIIQDNVLSPGLPKADLICAMNFSFFIFKQRKELVSYFKNCLEALEPGGVLSIDCFGGSECTEPNEEETEYEDEGYSYFWDQDGFDPLTHHAVFHIHFKRKGEKKRLNVFTYDWRMWTVPELKDALLDAGFSEVKTYWEGTTDDGEGDGNFHLAEKGEVCESWVAYLAALK